MSPVRRRQFLAVAGALVTALAPSPVPAQSADIVMVESVKPAPGTVLKMGKPVEFEFTLSYTLASRPQADLVVSLGQFVDSPAGCNSEKGELIASDRVTVKRGTGKATVRVTWKGGPAVVATGPSGYLGPAPSLWETGRRERIRYFGIDARYCLRYAR